MVELEQHGSSQKLADQRRWFVAQEQSPITNSQKELRQALDDVPADVIRSSPIDESERKVGNILSCRHVIALYLCGPSASKAFSGDAVSPDVNQTCAVMTSAKTDRIKFGSPQLKRLRGGSLVVMQWDAAAIPHQRQNKRSQNPRASV
jgi:hypothetical protein